MCCSCRLESHESPEMQAIREALGAIAMAEPAVYWLYSSDEGHWHLRREGASGEHCFPSRELALASIQLAVVRCASYTLFLQRSDGRIVREFFNWQPREPQDCA